jgi:hypothetical protein
LRAKLTTPDRQRERERDRERDNNKAQGIVSYLFFSKWGSLEKSRSQPAKFFLKKIKTYILILI